MEQNKEISPSFSYMRIGEKSYRDEIRQKCSDNKKKHFDELKDKGKLSKRLAKTRMCVSVEIGVPCKYLGECKFAHTLDELNIAECVFGSECSYVYNSNNLWYNKNDIINRCSFIHPNETKENYLVRINNNKYFQSYNHVSDSSRILQRPKHIKESSSNSDILLKKCNIKHSIKTENDWFTKVPLFRKREELSPTKCTELVGINSDLEEIPDGVNTEIEKYSESIENHSNTSSPVKTGTFVQERNDEVHVITAPSEMAYQIVSLAIKEGKKRIAVTITD
jgi:hypothetical protein